MPKRATERDHLHQRRLKDTNVNNRYSSARYLLCYYNEYSQSIVKKNIDLNSNMKNNNIDLKGVMVIVRDEITVLLHAYYIPALYKRV